MAALRGSAPELSAAEADALLRPTECRCPIRLVGLGADTETGEIRPVAEVKARCRSWRCDGCGLRLKRLHSDLIAAGMEWHQKKGVFGRFVTITFPSDEGAQVDDPDDIARCTALVARLIQELRRTHPGRVEYYAVKEATKTGRLHVHLIITGPYLRKCLAKWFPGPCTIAGCSQGSPEAPCRVPCHRAGGCVAKGGRPCMQAIAHRLGFGWVDVRKIQGARQAARYLAKYLNKQIGRKWPRYSRRTSYSIGRLECDQHPDQRGRRCCPRAHRRTGYCPPITIGYLWKRASQRAFAYAYLNGHIQPKHLDQRDEIVLWEYGGRAERPRAPPNIELTELELMRRHNRVTEARIRAAGYDPDNWQHGEAIRNLLRSARPPIT